MKKIIAVIILLACACTMFSCGETKETVNNINKMFSAYAPTRIYTTTSLVAGDYELTGTHEIKTGYIDGKQASVSIRDYEELIPWEEAGASDYVTLPWAPVREVMHYHEERGLRKNGGKWDPMGEDFVPMAGDIAPKFTEKNVTNVKKDAKANTVTFTVPAEKAFDVFGFEGTVDSDIEVVITHDGSVVTGISISYTVFGAEDNYPDIEITIVTEYSYSAQAITFD
ncbi:MAG: hypothetical protein J6V09_07130 [Clostridia bacterium]|nr:hypothetical protein [Clostridia bacterium]